MNERTPAPSSEIETRLEDLYAAIEPGEDFSRSLRAQLIERSSHLPGANLRQKHLHTAWQWVLGLAGLALLVGVIAFSVSLLPKEQAGPGGGPSSPVVQTVTVEPTTIPPAQSSGPLPEFPLQVGTTWVYSYIPYDPLPSDPFQTITATYVLTETVMEVKSEPEYFAARVARDKTLISAPPEWTQTESSASGLFWYVIQGKRIYEVDQDELTDFDPDSVLSHLDYQFPLSVGEKWCPVQVNLKSPDHPKVEDCSALGERTVARAMTYQTPAGKFDDCYQITEAVNSGGVTRLFCNGVGVVSANYDHAGTRFGFDQELVRYRAGEAESPASKNAGVTPSAESSVPSNADVPTALTAGSCGLPVETLTEQERRSFIQSQPQALAGGGRAASGNFDFSLWLVCDPSFSGDLAGGDDYSEIDGLGILAFWIYHGPVLEGSFTESSGIEPFVRESSGGGPVSSSYSGALLKGIQFPSGVIPDFSQGDARLRYLTKVRTPDGSLAGAGLSFTLQPGSGGYQVVDVQVQPLADADLRTLESASQASLPFPTRNVAEQYPELGELSGLLDRWQAPLLAGPGWLHILERIEDPAGNQMYGGLTEYANDSWYQLDESGRVIAFTNTYRSLDGRVLQQSFARDGEVINQTFGTRHAYIPYRIDLGSDLYDKAFRTVRAGQELNRQEIVQDGRTVWLYSFGESFFPAREIGGALTAAIQQQEAVEAQTGALLYSEMVRITPDGAGQLVWRHTNQVVARVFEPPGEVLSILGQEFKGYEPRPAVGTPAPGGFDAAQSMLSMQMVPGDDFDSPSFWYGDIYAGNYLLGRVDFGSAPGGWCDRSADGSRLAFNYEIAESETKVHASLRWFELSDLDNVHDPIPDLELRSPVAWSPQGDLLAFFACTPENQCGLYILDAGSDQVRLVSTVAWTLWEPVWKPDGTQIGFYVPDEQGPRLYVIDVKSGETVYPSGDQGETFSGWRVKMPDGMNGFGRCERPKEGSNP